MNVASQDFVTEKLAAFKKSCFVRGLSWGPSISWRVVFHGAAGSACRSGADCHKAHRAKAVQGLYMEVLFSSPPSLSALEKLLVSANPGFWPGSCCPCLQPCPSACSPGLAWPASACTLGGLLPLLRAGVLQGFSIPFDLLLLSLGKVTASLGWGPNSCLLAAINPEVLLHICRDASYLGHCFTFPACSLNNRFLSSSIATNPSYTRARRHASSAGKTMPLSPSYC